MCREGNFWFHIDGESIKYQIVPTLGSWSCAAVFVEFYGSCGLGGNAVAEISHACIILLPPRASITTPTGRQSSRVRHTVRCRGSTMWKMGDVCSNDFSHRWGSCPIRLNIDSPGTSSLVLFCEIFKLPQIGFHIRGQSLMPHSQT